MAALNGALKVVREVGRGFHVCYRAETPRAVQSGPRILDIPGPGCVSGSGLPGRRGVACAARRVAVGLSRGGRLLARAIVLERPNYRRAGASRTTRHRDRPIQADRTTG